MRRVDHPNQSTVSALGIVRVELGSTADRRRQASYMTVADQLDAEFEAFARRELGWLSRYAVVLTGDPELARDLIQDVMLKVLSRWGRVSAADHPRLYVRTMVTREFLSWRRRWSVRHIQLAASNEVANAAVADHASAVAERNDA